MRVTIRFVRLTLPIIIAWLVLLCTSGLSVAADTDNQNVQEQRSATAPPTTPEEEPAQKSAPAAEEESAQKPESAAEGNSLDSDNNQSQSVSSGFPSQISQDTADVSAQIEHSMETIETTHTMLEALTNEINASKETSASTRDRMQKITVSLKTIDQKLLEAYSDLDTSRTGIQGNAKKIDDLARQLQTLLENSVNFDTTRSAIDDSRKKIAGLEQSSTTFSRDIRANVSNLDSQKSLIEDNSIRLYELLIQLQELGKELHIISSSLANSTQDDFISTIKKGVEVDLNRLWLLLCTVLVFFASLAFVLSSAQGEQLHLADGADGRQGMILACLGVFLGYFVLGFGLMYGPTASGWIGIPTHLLQEIVPQEGEAAADAVISNFSFTGFVLYKTGFAMLAALIVYIAVGEKLTSVTHMLLALFVGAILIPIYGHWATSGHFITTNQGWLQGAGFVDQAGAITINTVAGWFALIVCWKIGNANPEDAKPAKFQEASNNEPVYSSSALLLLWLSWLGFTTGTLPISSDQISSVMLNAGLAASAGGITAFMHYVFFNADKNAIARGLGGFVSGLVAIAACAQSVTFIEAAFIGAVAGLLQNIAYRLVTKWFLSQAWQSKAAFLVAIHGVAGIWGALCFALLGTEGNFTAPNFIRLGTQVQGVVAAVAYSILMANVAVFLLRLNKTKKKVE